MDAKKLRIVFMGTPDFAVASLRALVEGGYNVVAVVTMPDKPAGRGLKVRESAVKQYAVEAGLRVLQPEKLKDPGFVEDFRTLDADLGIVIAFRMLPEVVWSAPRMGTFNLHASLLPRYRGAAPINRAIMNGEKETGVTTFLLNAGMDTGGILARERVVITDADTAGTLHDRLMETGSALVVHTVEGLAAGTLTPQPQPQGDENLVSAPKIFREDCLVRWNETPERIYDFVRGLSPYPAAWAYMVGKSAACVVGSENERGERERAECAPVAEAEPLTIKILSCRPERAEHSDLFGAIRSDGRTYLKAACRGGWIEITELQPAGRRRMSAEEFLRGFRDVTSYTLQ